MRADLYTELHARSAFSFLEGASIPEELAGVCAEKGMPAMALLDRDGVYGAPRFYLAAKKIPIQAHIGAEVTSAVGWRYPLLVESRAGYQNLCRLITRMKLRARKGEGYVTPEEAAEKSAGLICLTGGEEGPLAHALAHGGIEAATKCAQQLCELFGPQNVYVELQRHFRRDEEARNQAASEIARKLRLPLLATNGVCHARPPQREVLDVFTCIRHHRTLATAGRLLSRNSERHLKSPVEMAHLFSDLPEAIVNTQVLSSRLQFTLKDLGYEFPKYPVPDGGSQMQFMRQRVYEGMRWRYDLENERAHKQIDRELDLIEKLDLGGYFLIVWDIVRFCREHNILAQGRGSAANSAVCYALGITAVDPVGMDLLFERFLSEERGEWPDIDIDLPSGDQRERAIQYVYERYGKLGAAMTANVITYRGRSAAREIGKALSFDPETLNRLASLVGAWEYKDANDTLASQFRDAGLELEHPQIRKFLELCLAVQDLPRHLGQHSGGMVVCQGQLDSVVPLEPATMPGRVVVQWDKEDCADMGIVKVDLLGLGMMAVLEDSLKLIRDDYGEEVDLGHLPANDAAVYDALQKADTVGMFQVESRAQMSCLPRLRPKCFYDIVVQVAIIRPGPIVGKMVHPYLKRRQGREPAICLHPSLEPVLARTLGVPLFQEQLLRMAMIAAGFTGGEAEELRRAFGFKRSEARMKEVEKKLRRGMEKKGIAGEIQDKIVQSITSFALYGFPESHAASFALLAYASAYLKCHYLAAFTAAMVNNQPMGFYSPATIVKDAQRHGLKIRPIDVTRSEWLCTLERMSTGKSACATKNSGSPSLPSAGTPLYHAVQGGACRAPTDSGSDGTSNRRDAEDAEGAQRGLSDVSRSFTVRLGLRYVKGLREDVAQEISRQRAIRPFRSIEDLKLRVPAIQKSELAALAEIGALNFIGRNFIAGKRGSRGKGGRAIHRRDALWQVERAARRPGPLFETTETSDNEPGTALYHAVQGGACRVPTRPSCDGEISGKGDSDKGERADGTPALRQPSDDLSASTETSLCGSSAPLRFDVPALSPLLPMTPEERLVADFRGTGMTVGPHPMAYHRAALKRQGIRSAIELPKLPDGTHIRVAGAVIARQRPGTAKGFVFLSLEDETGIANAIITPQLFARDHVVVVHQQFLLIEGQLQNQDNVVSVKAVRVQPLSITRAETASHDFH
ncbi:MAG: error-prone DNA polymerase [Candidatus Acidiferrales bacterium]